MIIAKKGTRTRFSQESMVGQAPSRLRVKLSRVAESMEELMEVSAPTMPAMAMMVTPRPGKKTLMVSDRAVSEPANCCQGVVPRATVTVRE